MSQINFRVTEEEKIVIQAMADKKGLSTAEFAKQIVLNQISLDRKEIAFDLLKAGEIGRKRAWKMSGLNYYQFLTEWTKRGAEELIPDEAEFKTLEKALNLDLKPKSKKE